MKDTERELFRLMDKSYGNFMSGLLPGIEREKIIGVRLPILRKMASEMIKKGMAEEFLNELPHFYHEENHLHGFIIDGLNLDYNRTMELAEKFLPYIDNWSVCDSFKPKAFKTDLTALYSKLTEWMQSEKTYTIRLSLVLQIDLFLGADFEPFMLEQPAEISSDEYYVNMAIAWYYSMALVKQYDAAVTFLEKRRLAPWIHAKTIQKALESRQLGNDCKDYLRSLK